MPSRKHLNLQLRIPAGTTLEETLDLANLARSIRAKVRPEEWAALERWALAVASEASVDRGTRELLVLAGNSRQ